MTCKHLAVQLMVDHPHSAKVATAPLDEFIEDYQLDDNLWWRIESGHHQNLFEAAVDRIAELEAELLLYKPGPQE